jgi:catechol 2,3-dioxygenase-like lactoylglutathione lyase family enzyme
VFDHLLLRASDRIASREFYDTVLSTVGAGPRKSAASLDQWRDFLVAGATEDRPATQNAHVAFVTRSRDEVETFWRAGTGAGYQSDGEPGPRPQYGADYYGSFLLDPDGNSIEAVWLGRPRRGPNVVDHVWIRVADLGESRRFYTAVADPLGLQVDGPGHPERFSVRGSDRSFALVQDDRPVTGNLHMAFPVARNEDVHAFHRAALASGFISNGAPGERPQYGTGYFAAFAFDPDGNNIEAVAHNR